MYTVKSGLGFAKTSFSCVLRNIKGPAKWAYVIGHHNGEQGFIGSVDGNVERCRLQQDQNSVAKYID